MCPRSLALRSNERNSYSLAQAAHAVAEVQALFDADGLRERVAMRLSRPALPWKRERLDGATPDAITFGRPTAPDRPTLMQVDDALSYPRKRNDAREAPFDLEA